MLPARPLKSHFHTLTMERVPPIPLIFPDCAWSALPFALPFSDLATISSDEALFEVLLLHCYGNTGLTGPIYRHQNWYSTSREHPWGHHRIHLIQSHRSRRQSREGHLGWQATNRDYWRLRGGRCRRGRCCPFCHGRIDQAQPRAVDLYHIAGRHRVVAIRRHVISVRGGPEDRPLSRSEER